MRILTKGWLSIVGYMVFRKGGGRGGGMEVWRWRCGGGDGALEVLEMCWRCDGGLTGIRRGSGWQRKRRMGGWADGRRGRMREGIREGREDGGCGIMREGGGIGRRMGNTGWWGEGSMRTKDE